MLPGELKNVDNQSSSLNKRSAYVDCVSTVTVNSQLA